MNIYRCLICGEPYIGTDRPSNCPFCGASSKHLVPAARWIDPKVQTLSDLSRRNLEKALDIEIKASIFYERASRKTSDIKGEAMFIALSKIKERHASIITKMLNMHKPPFDFSEQFEFESLSDMLSESLRREKLAFEFFRRTSIEATEPRIKEFFTALAEISGDHIELAKKK